MKITQTLEHSNRVKEANSLARNSWIGTPKQIKARKAFYIKNGRFADILNNL